MSFEEKYAAMSPEERAAGWDAYHGLTARTWKLYTCSDCDPENADDEQPAEYDTLAVIVIPDDISRPDHCPRCGSYLSLGESTAVCVTTLGATPNTTPKDK